MDADKKRLWVSGQFIEVTDEVYDAYMKGDRKMRYFESDLKTERFLMDENGQIRQVIPSREDSLDRLMDDNAEQFADRHESVEDMVLRRISIAWLANPDYFINYVALIIFVSFATLAIPLAISIRKRNKTGNYICLYRATCGAIPDFEEFQSGNIAKS